MADRTPEDVLEEVIDEFRRRERLRALIARAGFAKSDTAWVPRSSLTRAVAKLLNRSPSSHALRLELARFLRADGWVERAVTGTRQIRATSKANCERCNWVLAKDGGCRRCAAKAAK